jgi:hypothetical protein
MNGKKNPMNPNIIDQIPLITLPTNENTILNVATSKNMATNTLEKLIASNMSIAPFILKINICSKGRNRTSQLALASFSKIYSFSSLNERIIVRIVERKDSEIDTITEITMNRFETGDIPNKYANIIIILSAASAIAI